MDVSDGIILVIDKLEQFCKKEDITKEDIILLCKQKAKPIIITTGDPAGVGPDLCIMLGDYLLDKNRFDEAYK